MEYFSNYNCIIDFSDDSFLLYNSFSNSFVELPAELKEKIGNTKMITDSNLFDKKTYRLLKKIGAIYEGTKDKQINSLKLRHGNRTFVQTKQIILTILPTLECNFRCSYCFEFQNQVFKSQRMSKNIQDLLIDKICHYYEKGYKISLAWFGGEPLVASDIIHYISSKLNFMGVEFDATMITNGYLLTPEIIGVLKDWNINKIQVTIDGDEYTHDARRMLIDGGKTYQVIMNNLKYLKKSNQEIDVSIRINIDKTNEIMYSHIATIIERELPGMYYYPGFVTSGCSLCNGNVFTNHIEKADFYIEQYKEYDNLSLTYFPSFNSGHCMATNFNSWIVGPEGEMYNCQAEVGLKSKVIGNLKDNTISDMDYVSEFMVGVSPFENEQCRKCFALPICGGGCALERINKKNGEKIDTCTIFKNKEKLGELLKIHYDIKKKRQEITTL